jgi:hypothetical protein
MIFIIFNLFAFLGCGGSIDKPTTPSDSSTTPVTPSIAAASTDLLVSSPQLGSDGSSKVTITAIVKSSNNVALKDKTVAFASNSGALVVTSGTTDASGAATATLSAAGDKSNRTITITATSDSITATNTVAVVGTTLAITGQAAMVAGATTTLLITLKDSAGTAIGAKVITLTSQKGNPFSSNTVTTDANGQATVTYTATSGGVDNKDTVTATGQGATATLAITISTTDFTFTAPAANAEISIGAVQPVTVHYAVGGVPVGGVTVSFSTTRGTFPPPPPATAVTNAGGDATVTVSSTTAGPAVLTASITVLGVVSSIQRSIEFVAVTAAAVTLQATPGTISTNTAGSTVQQSNIIAVVRDVNGNLVKNKTVRFTLADISGGYISQASSLTDSLGTATTVYISSTSPSVYNGVRIDVTIDGSAATAHTTLTVANRPIYVVFGTGNTIENYSATQYRAPFSALVTDIAGNPQAGVTVTANLIPVTFLKGSYTGCLFTADVYWTWSPSIASSNLILECVNEDNNVAAYGITHPEWLLNGVKDSGINPITLLWETEDINQDGVLTPGNIATVTTSAVTDANGFAQFYVIYAKQFASWVKVKIEGRIYSYGDQSLGTTTFLLPGLRDDYKCTTSPPGPISPFGMGAGANNVCTNNN